MPDDIDTLVRRLVAGDPEVHDRILDRATAGDSCVALVAAALLTADRDLVDRARTQGVTTRDRQLAAVVTAHLDDDQDLFDALVRDHLSDHPDSVLAAWIAALHAGTAHPPTTPSGDVMHTLEVLPAPAGTRPASWWRTAARWMVTFVGFPLGGLVVYLLVGPVDSPGTAVTGGLITGAVVGAVQAWALGRRGRAAAEWTAVTAAGLAVGLGAGATAVGFATSTSALLVQGAVSGIAVGGAQAFALRSRLGRVVLAWPILLGGIWAAGWAVTAGAGILVEERFPVFGASGALVVTALTAVLPLLLDRTRGATS